jgi:hypothetical protein
MYIDVRQFTPTRSEKELYYMREIWELEREHLGESPE